MESGFLQRTPFLLIGACMAQAIQQIEKNLAANAASTLLPVIVVGSGPVGVQVVRELLKRDDRQSIILFGDEPWELYNRVKLSALLRRELGWSSVKTQLSIPENSDLVQHQNCAIVSIDRTAGCVTDQDGNRYYYSVLVLATGSRPHVPHVPGIGLPGVYTFRDLGDVQNLLARQARTHRTVVVGGGLLGLEAARAMQRMGTQVTVIDHSTRLMPRQLDAGAGGCLAEYVGKLGIRTILGDGVRQVLGSERVDGLRTINGVELACDTIVISAGIEPNTDLALGAGLAIGRGISVDDRMCTNDPRVYAIGECAEHRGQIYGTVAPGLEQAAVAAHAILKGEAHYSGSIAAARLKVLGKNVFSMGQVNCEGNEISFRQHVYHDRSLGIYRKLVFRNMHLVGAMAVGDWKELPRVQEKVSKTRRIWPWQIYRFSRTGRLWKQSDAGHVSEWPATAIVCNCTSVTRGELDQAIAGGCGTIKQVSTRTGASTVCGSCRPLLAQLLGANAGNEPLTGKRMLLGASMIALLLSILVTLRSPLPISASVQNTRAIDFLWIDAFWKQVTGFSLLGFSTLILLLSARKRIKRFSVGDYAWWRLAHVIVAVLLLIVLAAHTGLRFGENLNLALMLVYTGVMLAGALAGSIVALESGIGGQLGRRLRRWGNWLHLLFFWPLPALLGFHVLSVYYF
jgi:nitrite reductase (NADH) large subunit